MLSPSLIYFLELVWSTAEQSADQQPCLLCRGKLARSCEEMSSSYLFAPPSFLTLRRLCCLELLWRQLLHLSTFQGCKDRKLPISGPLCIGAAYINYQCLDPKRMRTQSFQSLCTGRERDVFCAKKKISYFLAASQAGHVKQSRRQKSICHSHSL